MTSAPNAVVSYAAKCAHDANRFAVWSRRMAAGFPYARDFYLSLADKSRSNARQHIADARKFRSRT